MNGAPYVVIPRIVFEAFERGEIDLTKFVILCALHLWADHRSGRIDSFSAERMLRYMHIDASPSAKRTMQRHVSTLMDMGWFHWDYVPGSVRPYHVWLHNYRLVQKGSLSVSQLVAESVADNDAENVAEEKVLNPCAINPYPKSQPLNVADNDAENVAQIEFNLSPNNQGDVRETPQPPAGASPLRPSGERSSGAGLLKPTTKRVSRALSVEQDAMLDEAVLRYSDFSNIVWDFVPDNPNLKIVLRHASPDELALAQLHKFRFSRRESTMAHFFAKGARVLIDANRLEKKTDAELFAQIKAQVNERQHNAITTVHESWSVAAEKLTAALNAWRKVFPEPAILHSASTMQAPSAHSADTAPAQDQTKPEPVVAVPEIPNAPQSTTKPESIRVTPGDDFAELFKRAVRS